MGNYLDQANTNKTTVTGYNKNIKYVISEM